MKTKMLIDGDVIAYVASAAVELKVDWEDGEGEQYYGDEQKAFDHADDQIRRILGKTKAEPVVVLSGGFNFREETVDYYKGNRKGSHKPILRTATEDYLMGAYESYREDRLEGDDLLAIFQTGNFFEDTIIWTIDKDLRMVPGKHLDAKTLKIIVVDELEGMRWFHTQCLTGDPTDNYKGCPKVGKVGAEKALRDCTTVDEMWEAVVKVYESKGYTEELALENARLAWMYQVDDYCFETEKVRLYRGDWI